MAVVNLPSLDTTAAIFEKMYAIARYATGRGPTGRADTPGPAVTP
jgi:hypothetical protein